MAFTTIALLALAGASAGASAYGSIKAGRAAKAIGESEGQLADFNAAVADQQAQDALDRGQLDAHQYRAQVRQALGAQRAAFAGSHLALGEGSTADVAASTAYLGELDALTVENNAAREAWGYKVEASDYRKRAAIARKGGQQAIEAARWQAGTTLLSTGTSLLAARYGMGSKAPKAPTAPSMSTLMFSY